MAVKTTKKKATSAKKEDINLTVQKIASNTAKEVQKMVNSANSATLKANASESEKARLFNQQEATTARNFNAQQAVLEREFNAAEAEKSRAWQKMMSDTSHQREVADLKKAGLNPVLSANGGAQSYTTSSASAGAASTSAASSTGIGSSLESGAGAFGSIMSGLLGTLASLENTKVQAATNLKAARTSAAATKYAADKSAAAQKYAADTQYAIAMQKPQSNPFSLFDKYFGNNLSSKNSEKIKEGINEFFDNPIKYVVDKGKQVTKNNLTLTKVGNWFVNQQLSHMDKPQTDEARKLWTSAFIFGDKYAAQKLQNLTYRRKTTGIQR